MARRPVARFAVPLAASLVLIIVGGATISAAGRIVTFRATDGRTLSGLLTEASTRPAPAVVLVPMLGRPKDDWQIAAQRLADANLTSLAIDLPATSVPAEPRDLAAWSEDIRAAITYLEGRPEVRARSLGVAGASLGGSLAAVAAATDLRIRSLALISPSLEYRGLSIAASMRTYGSRPALLLASRHDPYAARSARELAAKPPGVREVQLSDMAAHGTVLLTREPDLVRILVEWFQRTLA